MLKSLKIESDGTSMGTFIDINGERLNTVQDLIVLCNAKQKRLTVKLNKCVLIDGNLKITKDGRVRTRKKTYKVNMAR